MPIVRNPMKKSFMFLPLQLLFISFLFLATSVQAASPQAREALADNPSLAYAPDSVLIRFKSDALPAQKQQARNLVNGKMARGYGIVQALELLQFGPGRGVETAIETLQKLPFVEYVEPDYVRRANTNDTYYDLQWGLENTGQDIRGVTGTADADIDAELAWGTTTGDPGVVVAVIDTGVEYSHEDLDANIWINPGEAGGNGIDDDSNGYIDDIYGYDFFDNDNDPMDVDGHGTHVSGTICAEGNNSTGVSGVAWQCKIMALRFLGPSGGYTSDAIAALDYAVDKGVRVSNNSWGGGGYSQGLYDAISSAAGNGHLFVAAAGNDGDDTDAAPHYPSSYDLDNIISVAATDNLDQLAGFSNFGLTSVDVGAPGVDIASTMLGTYYWSSGTSMAAPYVTGVAALILSAHSDWGYAEISGRIFNTSRAIAALDGKTVTGGVVNAYDALLEPTVAPDAPINLSAATVSHAQIDLAWYDNSDNEEGFRIERSLDSGSTWAEVASVAADVVSYSDSSLDAETTYHYRVYAFNSAGDSDYSNNIANAITDPMPSGQEVVSSSEIFGAGSVQGTYEDTWVDDGVNETSTERSSGGRPSSRYSYLQHTWVFEVPAGSMTLYMNAWSSNSADDDSFVFSYSLDGSTFFDMLTITGDGGTSWHSYAFPPNSSGTVHIRVKDTDRTAGNLDLDTVTVDQMYILSETDAGDPPAAPFNLTGTATVAGQIDLAWIDNALDEYGFEVERFAVGAETWNLLATLDADTQAYSDTTVASETAYDYRVRAYNGAGYSSYSNTVSATSLTSAALELTASGDKVKGWQSVDLAWNDTKVMVDVYRDGNIITTVSEVSYTDPNIGKGGGSYTYQVCETDMSICSNEAVVTF